ncbi:LysE family translocator [Pseudomaricurvus alkylphenolicus]|uniref:LysE family translocator n=1 Tax=Pseudomaricurvus alkylphenolicus TaxID=1306991 RepID=UPI00141F6A26|nr:LysE family translocator [Pseudomaricurvus alkylphenolicus]NIB41742.1 LysE family translocator [Pseudomaricurvus alkylphenolicus]
MFTDITTTIIAIGLYALSMSISPGPVNMLALSCGVRLGLRKAMGFVSGATIGFSLLLLAIGLGLSNLVDPSSVLFKLLKFSGLGFIAWIGFRIATSAPENGVIQHRDTQNEPTGGSTGAFWHGFLLQWLNPKAWLACIAGIAAFGVSSLHELWVFSGIYFCICYPSIAAWALLGNRLQQWLRSSRNMRRFNLVMGLSLILVATSMI